MNGSVLSTNRKSFLVTAVVVSAAFLLSSCAGTGGLGEFNLISKSEERELGENLADEIARQGDLIDDPAVTTYINDVGYRLVAVSMRPDYPYEFHVIDKKEVNAFAIPGGHMYIHTGLILAADREAEVAGVMAHELGHAEERHTTQQLSRYYGLSLLTNVLLGKNPSQTEKVVSGLLGNMAIMKYSRDAEREADYIAVHLLHRAGYDPLALADFFRKLKEMHEQSPGPLESLFLSHPMTEDRIAFVEQEVRQLAPREVIHKNTEQFKRIQQRLQAG